MPIVTNPQAGDVHVNRPLTNFGQKYLQDAKNFISLDAVPNVPSTRQADLYYEFDRDDFFRDEAQERADGTESAGGQFDLSTNPYFTRVYAWHKDVTDRQRANADDGIDLDRSAAQYVTQKLMIRRERLFAATMMAASSWATSGAPSPLWSAATGDPIKDFRTQKRAIQTATGFRPNKAIFGRTALDAVLENDLVLDRMTGGATRDTPALVRMAQLTELLELDRIFVMDGIYTSSIKGASSTTRALINSNDALLYYAPDTVNFDEPTAAVQFSWTGLLGNTPNGMRIKRFRHEPTESDRVEGQMAFDYKVTGSALGHLFTSVSS